VDEKDLSFMRKGKGIMRSRQSPVCSIYCRDVVEIQGMSTECHLNRRAGDAGCGYHLRRQTVAMNCSNDHTDLILVLDLIS
jgi:hypothetical protein